MLESCARPPPPLIIAINACVSWLHCKSSRELQGCNLWGMCKKNGVWAGHWNCSLWVMKLPLNYSFFFKKTRKESTKGKKRKNTVILHFSSYGRLFLLFGDLGYLFASIEACIIHQISWQTTSLPLALQLSCAVNACYQLARIFSYTY